MSEWGVPAYPQQQQQQQQMMMGMPGAQQQMMGMPGAGRGAPLGAMHGGQNSGGYVVCMVPVGMYSNQGQPATPQAAMPQNDGMQQMWGDSGRGRDENMGGHSQYSNGQMQAPTMWGGQQQSYQMWDDRAGQQEQQPRHNLGNAASGSWDVSAAVFVPAAQRKVDENRSQATFQFSSNAKPFDMPSLDKSIPALHDYRNTKLFNAPVHKEVVGENKAGSDNICGEFQPGATGQPILAGHDKEHKSDINIISSKWQANSKVSPESQNPPAENPQIGRADASSIAKKPDSSKMASEISNSIHDRKAQNGTSNIDSSSPVRETTNITEEVRQSWGVSARAAAQSTSGQLSGPRSNGPGWNAQSPVQKGWGKGQQTPVQQPSQFQQNARHQQKGAGGGFRQPDQRQPQDRRRLQEDGKEQGKKEEEAKPLSAAEFPSLIALGAKPKKAAASITNTAWGKSAEARKADTEKRQEKVDAVETKCDGDAAAEVEQEKQETQDRKNESKQFSAEKNVTESDNFSSPAEGTPPIERERNLDDASDQIGKDVTSPSKELVGEKRAKEIADIRIVDEVEDRSIHDMEKEVEEEEEDDEEQSVGSSVYAEEEEEEDEVEAEQGGVGKEAATDDPEEERHEEISETESTEEGPEEGARSRNRLGQHENAVVDLETNDRKNQNKAEDEADELDTKEDEDETQQGDEEDEEEEDESAQESDKRDDTLVDRINDKGFGNVDDHAGYVASLLFYRGFSDVVPEDFIYSAVDQSRLKEEESPKASEPTDRAMFGSRRPEERPNRDRRDRRDRDRRDRDRGDRDRDRRETEKLTLNSLGSKAENAYKRRDNNAASVSREEELKRCSQSLLNKICPENIGTIAKRIKTEAQVATIEELETVIGLIFKKALAEPHYCETYATMVFMLKGEMPSFPNPNGGKEVTFKSVLLNVCQSEFEKMPRTVESCRSEGENVDEEELKFRIDKMKGRFLANMKFIGHLFLQKLLSSGIIAGILSELLGCNGDGDVIPQEHVVECVCELLTAIGHALECMATGKECVTQVCGRLTDLKGMKKKDGKGVLSKRIQFGIQDVMDMRKAGWVKKTFKAVAKTKEEVRAQAEKEEKDMKSGKAVSGADVVVAGARPTYMQSADTPSAKQADSWQEINSKKSGRR